MIVEKNLDCSHKAEALDSEIRFVLTAAIVYKKEKLTLLSCSAYTIFISQTAGSSPC